VRTGAVVAVVVVLQGLAVRGAAVPIGPGDQARARGPVPRAALRLPAAIRWQWPLEPAPAVVRRFQPAPTPWGAGHRGVDLAAQPGQPVLAAGAGVVGFAGVIAGRGVVTVVHAGGLRTTYEPVTARARPGTIVVAGDEIGRVDATPGHCGPATCLHWGLLRGVGPSAVYLDPLALVGALGIDLEPPVLLPLR
jgi:murein DD-endopeptidase MepM/ murein hydrolase activator NlpD